MLLFKPEDCLILVVDDVRQNLQVIGEILEMAGYEATFAPSGQQALSRVKTAHPDLILLDLMMPEMSGLEVCEILKNDPKFSEIPIIFLTASNEVDNLLQAFKKGANDYITKPFRSEEILVRIEAQLTNQKLKKKLEEKNQELEAEIEVRRRTEEALQQAIELANAANRAKSNFLANMSHELRTPLNAILGFTQLLTHSSNLTQEQKNHLSIIHRSGDHLLKLINDILDLSKEDEGEINLTEFILKDMLVELEEMFGLKLREKGLKLEILVENRVPLTIESDRIKLRQILINLLSNAIKFTFSGGIKLRVNAILDPEKTWLSFEITDTGIGMTSEDLSKLFQPFLQTETGLVNLEGTGLGLVICRKYVRLLGGDITVSSEPDVGTTFKFQIVVNPVESTDSSPGQNWSPRVRAIAPNQPLYRILVADDEATNREVLTTMLSSVGFDVKEATNGQEALEIYHSFEPHLIWMDVRMSILDGCEAAQQIKATCQKSIPTIIAVTSSVFEEDKASILSAGYDDFLIKPIRESKVFEKISKHLGVSYIYEEMTSILSDHLRSRETQWKNLIKLPTSVICDLEYATLALDDERLNRLVSEIPSECGELAQIIRDCLENFDYHTILEAIKSAKAERFANSHFSSEWMMQITQAVYTADLNEIKQLIAQIAPENQELAAQLEYYLAHLDYQNILRAISEIEETPPPN
ncbi:response regulator [Oscillatoria acuminata]|uniref:Circadian input-output histidine kinase CikA n=1 Tax=Oscillatoria acuminata PCC 6304 TaxID=56110 RepID=K9TKL2_9CYAN|nr:response regulator [Oscillatoria acuminata]AFY82559.1 signal transduction histidine kinase [Oscillatoria acuminata PCC 6304]